MDSVPDDRTDELGVRKFVIPIVAVLVFGLTVVVGLFLTRPATAPSRDLPSVAVAEVDESQKGETVQIPSLGLSVFRPADWVTVTADQNSRNIRSVQMDDPEFQEMAARYANAPVFAIAKYPEPYADLNPSFKINVRPLGGLARLAPEDILTAALPTFSRAFRDAQILEGPRSAQVSGRKAAYAKLAYTLRANDLAVPTISEIWVVPKGSIFFLIGAGTRADEKNGTRAEIRQIMDRLRIE
ncbi:hypothetical protein LZ016_13825 [Sphingomonas sp. SM33]|uniref:Uncharacterized protein n=1 Tax=Sphingomonas telluris TaxID=2907998 RepID=A0ABS9VQE4_9SPHN|nr:hypothetical protein [Sphingomonas telluris]MCH8617172.1 hypothetical protein [Sphingomonas telluris]